MTDKEILEVGKKVIKIESEAVSNLYNILDDEFVKAAKIILNGVKKNKSRIFIGLDARLLDLSQRMFPKHYHKTWLFFIPLLTMFRNKKPLKSIE